VDTRVAGPSRGGEAPTVYVTPTSGSRARPGTAVARVDLLRRVLDNQRLDATVLATPVRLTPSRPNQVDRVYANLRSATAITGPSDDEAWVLMPAASAGWGPVAWQNTLFSGATPLTELSGNPRLALTIRRAALGSKALVECGVTAQGDGTVALGGSVSNQTIAVKSGSQHLNIVVDPASSTGDVELHLEPASPIAVNYCEIAALKY
jgi:hypothetical protein